MAKDTWYVLLPNLMQAYSTDVGCALDLSHPIKKHTPIKTNSLPHHWLVSCSVCSIWQYKQNKAALRPAYKIT